MPDALLSSLMGNFLWQATLLCFVAIAALKFLPKAHARTRYFIALSGFFGVPLLMLAPFLPTLLPEISMGISPQPLPAITDIPQASFVGNHQDIEAWAKPVVPSITEMTPPVQTETAYLPNLPYTALLVGLWGMGVLIGLARILIAGVMGRQWVQRAEPAYVQVSHLDRSLSQPITIRRSEKTDTPMLLGLLRPIILVPCEFSLDLDDSENGTQTRAILEHEIAHLTRYDLWTNLFQRLVLAALWWFTPLYWVHDHIASEREKLCDDRAAKMAAPGQDADRTSAARALALALVNLADTRPHNPQLLAVGIHPGQSDLADRVTRLCTGQTDMTPSTRWLLAGTALAVPLMLTGLTLTTPRAYAEHPDGDRRYAISTEARKPLSDRQKALVAQVMRNHTAPALKLLAEGADPNFSLSGDGSPLLMAARNGNFKLVKALVKAGADPNMYSPGDGTPMTAGALSDHANIIRFMIDNGGDVNLAAPGDGNPLIVAAHTNSQETARLLINNGADVNAFVPGDETPLMNAARGGHMDMVKYLIDQGADITFGTWSMSYQNGKTDNLWRTAYSEALLHDHTRVAAYIKQQAKARSVDHNPAPEGAPPARESDFAWPRQDLNYEYDYDADDYFDDDDDDDDHDHDYDYDYDNDQDMDYAHNGGLQITSNSGSGIGKLTRQLRSDGFVERGNADYTLGVKDGALYLDGEPLPAGLTPGYIDLLGDIGIDISSQTRLSMDVDGESLSMTIGGPVRLDLRQ